VGYVEFVKIEFRKFDESREQRDSREPGAGSPPFLLTHHPIPLVVRYLEFVKFEQMGGAGYDV